jgi:hypothetical protein
MMTVIGKIEYTMIPSVRPLNVRLKQLALWEEVQWPGTHEDAAKATVCEHHELPILVVDPSLPGELFEIRSLGSQLLLTGFLI